MTIGDPRHDRYKYSKRMAEITGETLEYTDMFTEQVPLNDSVFDRVPKCCKPKPLKPKGEKMIPIENAIKEIRQCSNKLDAQIKDGKHDNAWPDHTKYIKDEDWAMMLGRQLAYHQVLRLLAFALIEAKK